ncbi:MAG: hypothetical protein D6816_11280, partial [Bacteroidetes bacterium]
MCAAVAGGAADAAGGGAGSRHRGSAVGELLAFLYDIHGSTRALVDTNGVIKNDTAGGNGVQAFTYDAYGKLIATTFG